MYRLWFIILVTTLFIQHFSFGQVIVINEIMSSNETTIIDEDGDYSDWIELFNNSNNTVNLLGYRITDDVDNPDKCWMNRVVTNIINHNRYIYNKNNINF